MQLVKFNSSDKLQWILCLRINKSTCMFLAILYNVIFLLNIYVYSCTNCFIVSIVTVYDEYYLYFFNNLQSLFFYSLFAYDWKYFSSVIIDYLQRMFEFIKFISKINQMTAQGWKTNKSVAFSFYPEKQYLNINKFL